jgi:rifampicin phosphotransferase
LFSLFSSLKKSNILSTHQGKIMAKKSLLVGSIHHFDAAEPVPPIPQVGGKGYSLIRMARNRVPVPPGFVLSVTFFTPWHEALLRTDAWIAFVSGLREKNLSLVSRVKEEALALSFTAEQTDLLDTALNRYSGENLFAVRSSSPEEDLAGASFAGGYETVLGVTARTMKQAIRTAFASCLDPRVFVYKSEQGFDLNDFRIAVVVQEQVASDVAGVGFTLNPLNNDYDEMLINANWGLGESVVSGLATPDEIVVDRVNRKVLSYGVGPKETSVWLKEHGGTLLREDPRHDERTLSDRQVLELTDALTAVEALYGKPMDTEWAFSGGRLHLLQARPVTTHLTLPASMVTPVGAPKRLYVDASLVVQAFQEPMSVLGTDLLKRIIGSALETVFGSREFVDGSHPLVIAEAGRLFGDVSLIRHIAGSYEAFADAFYRMDTITADIIRAVPAGEYRVPRPTYLDRINPRVLFKNPHVVETLFEEMFMPDHLEKEYAGIAEAYMRDMEDTRWEELPFEQAVSGITEKIVHLLTRLTVPVFLIAKKSDARLRDLFPNEGTDPLLKHLLEQVDRSLPGNRTMEMGFALYALSRTLQGIEPMAEGPFMKAVARGEMPKVFTEAWGEFLHAYGFRGPGELDLAYPRYADDPEAILAQVWQLWSEPESDNPLARFEKGAWERERAAVQLEKMAGTGGWLKKKEFQFLYRVIEHFGGYRENHKHYLIRGVARIRMLVLALAERLCSRNILEKKEDIFDLTFEDIGSVMEKGASAGEAAKSHLDEINALFRAGTLPPVIDSRGRILRPEVRVKEEGAISGQSVSSGTATGKVKVLHTANEKPILPGEILVARATDPGWTPLFVNAAAIILEVGGTLQHGALVAREYGKPCVVGIADAVNRFSDGMQVEVDGSAGIVRILDP